MARGAAVTIKGRVKYIQNLRVCVDGVVYDVRRALTQCNGLARQWWPPENGPPPDPPNLPVIDPNTAMSFDIRQTPSNARARFGFINSTGTLYWTQDDNPNAEERIFANPPQAGEYLVRVTSSGDTIDGPTGWIDPATQTDPTQVRWTLINNDTSASTLSATGVFEVSANDGAGNPVGDILGTKTINWSAEVTGFPTSGIIWSTRPWSLSDVRVGEDAEVRLTALYNLGTNVGTVTGREGGVIAEQEDYANPAQRRESVTLTAVSGDTDQIVGPPLGVPVQLDFVNNLVASWKLTAATDGTTYSAVVDMTFSDGADSVTKRINLYAERSGFVDPSSNLTVQSGPFGGVAIGTLAASLTFSVRGNQSGGQDGGTLNFFDQDGVQQSEFPQAWLDSAPTTTDAQDFEVRLASVNSGFAPNGAGNPATGFWVSAADSPLWTCQVVQGVNEPILKQIDWLFEFRIFGSSVIQTMIIRGTINVEDFGGNNPNDPSNPGGPVDPNPPDLTP